MEKWQWTTLLLCAFGFFKELRPSEPFVTKYLIEFKGFTKETIVHVAYPIATYTYFAALPIIFLVTDFLRYRPIIILEAVAFVGVFSMLIWTNGLLALKVIEVLYGIAGACEIAYFTYMYAKVDKAHYKLVTSYTYGTIFAGNFVAAVLSQLLVSMSWMNYHQLNFISLAGVGSALIASLCLPSVAQSLYFYREPAPPGASAAADTAAASGDTDADAEAANLPTCYEDEENDNSRRVSKVSRRQLQLPISERVRRAYPILWRDFKNAYSNSYVLKWSLWWAVATAGHLQITNYYQTLWEEIEPAREQKVYNGGVSAVQSALSAILAFYIGHLKVSWRKWGESFLCLISIVQGCALLWFSQTDSLITGYVLLVVYRTFYQMLITVASAEVAQGISEDSYGLIFGLNTFIAVCIQTVLTLAINEEGGLELGIRSQFLVYGCYYGLLGLAFLAVTISTAVTSRSCTPAVGGAGAAKKYNNYRLTPTTAVTVTADDPLISKANNNGTTDTSAAANNGINC